MSRRSSRTSAAAPTRTTRLASWATPGRRWGLGNKDADVAEAYAEAKLARHELIEEEGAS
jgi:hypothetical protein